MKTAMGAVLCVVLGVAMPAGAVRAARQGPPPGPAGQPGKTVVFIAADFRNGGVMGAYRGFDEATRRLGWRVVLEDGQGLRATQAALLSQAAARAPDGIVFGGFDPQEFEAEAAVARRRGIVLVGWHAGSEPEPTRLLFANVSTRSVDVARMAVDFVLQDAAARKRPVGVVIFTDAQYAVANAKTAAMKKGIEACRAYHGCRVLAVENVPISDVRAQIPARVPRLNARHGGAWTYTLAVNDAYFDEIHFPLIACGRRDIANVSAGDGSGKAVGRIAAGVSQQVATVAEPLRLQGYQLADELNRAFAGVPPSGFQSMPVLVTSGRGRAGQGAVGDAARGVEAAYDEIWIGR